VTGGNPLVPPPQAHDPALWMAGYRQRLAHRPAGGSTVCPACLRPWQCRPYLEAIGAMTAACRPAECRPRVVGVAHVARHRAPRVY
jgi:hypothetical protein